MQTRHFETLIMRAASSQDKSLLNRLAIQLSDSERAREILRAKGYGATGTSASTTAAQVPNAARNGAAMK